MTKKEEYVFRKNAKAREELMNEQREALSKVKHEIIDLLEKVNVGKIPKQTIGDDLFKIYQRIK